MSNCIKKLLDLPLDKQNEEHTYYFIDTALIGHLTLSYSFNEEEREEIEKKLKKEAIENLIKDVKYKSKSEKLNWLDYKRLHIGNLFCSKKEAEEKLDLILKILKD